MSKKEKRVNISINTGEPIEEKELDLNPTAPLAVDDAEDGEDDDDELKIDDEELDPYADKWEQ
jgi:RNA polymerase-binding transcription factor DksA